MPKRIILSDEIEKRREEGTIIIVGSEGQEWSIEPPDLWPQDKIEKFLKARNNDLEELGKLTLGDDEYAEFVADGGTSAFLARLVQSVRGDLGESSASSSS